MPLCHLVSGCAQATVFSCFHHIRAIPRKRKRVGFSPLPSKHADACATPAPTARLMNEPTGYLRARCAFAEAEPLLRRALAVDEHSFGSDHPRVATDLNNLGQLLQATNRLAEERLMCRALAIDMSGGAQALTCPCRPAFWVITSTPCEPFPGSCCAAVFYGPRSQPGETNPDPRTRRWTPPICASTP